jgi:hypothetical protein
MFVSPRRILFDDSKNVHGLIGVIGTMMILDRRWPQRVLSV